MAVDPSPPLTRASAFDYPPPPLARTCTWLSTDGGVTFKDVAEGSYIYEYADWGSTIIMAKHPGLMAAPASESRQLIGRWVSSGRTLGGNN